MFKNSCLKFLFSLILVSVVLSTEILDCLFQTPVKNHEISLQANNASIGHACDVDVKCAHTGCHSHHFCKAELNSSRELFLDKVDNAYSSHLEKIYKNPFSTIFLRPPIFT